VKVVVMEYGLQLLQVTLMEVFSLYTECMQREAHIISAFGFAYGAAAAMMMQV
jgi:hypothetical protein